MKLHVLSAAVLGICLCVPAIADSSVEIPLDEQSKLTQELLKYDTNKDGIITLEEKAAVKAAEFDAADIDKDGFLTWDEFKTMMDAKRTARLTAMFKVADKDGSGVVSADEFLNIFAVGQNAAQAATVFAIMDTTTADGGLTPTELNAALAGNEPVAQLMWKFAGMDTLTVDAKLSKDEYVAKPAKLPKPPKLPKPNTKGKK